MMDKLTTAIREIQSSARGLRPAIAVPGSHPASTFVQQLWQRYAAQPVRWPHVALVWHRRPTPPSSISHFHSAHIALAPRLALTVLQRPEATQSSQLQAQHPDYGQQQLQLRTVVGTGRVEVGDRRRSAPVQDHPAQPAFAAPPPSVARVVVRPAEPVAAPPATATPAVPPATAGWSQPSPFAAQPDVPGTNVNQLTDQVVRAIDQRIIAERERLGRV